MQRRATRFPRSGELTRDGVIDAGQRFQARLSMPNLRRVVVMARWRGVRDRGL